MQYAHELIGRHRQIARGDVLEKHAFRADVLTFDPRTGRATGKQAETVTTEQPRRSFQCR